MRRIKYACLDQTLHFSLRDAYPADETTRLVQTEVEQYKADLERKGVRYRIISEDVQTDGTILLKIRKQYNDHNCGNYLD